MHYLESSPIHEGIEATPKLKSQSTGSDFNVDNNNDYPLPIPEITHHVKDYKAPKKILASTDHIAYEDNRDLVRPKKKKMKKTKRSSIHENIENIIETVRKETEVEVKEIEQIEAEIESNEKVHREPEVQINERVQNEIEINEEVQQEPEIKIKERKPMESQKRIDPVVIKEVIEPVASSTRNKPIVQPIIAAETETFGFNMLDFRGTQSSHPQETISKPEATVIEDPPKEILNDFEVVKHTNYDEKTTKNIEKRTKKKLKRKNIHREKVDYNMVRHSPFDIL